MMKMLTKSVFAYVIAITFLLLGAVIVMQINVTYSFLNFSNTLIDNHLNSNINNLENFLDRSVNYSIQAASYMSKNPEVIKAVREKDTQEALRLFSDALVPLQVNYFTIADYDGNVIARTHEPESFGDSIMNQLNVRNALKGHVSSNFEPGRFVKVSVRTGAPVFDNDGSIIGVIISGVRVDTQEVVEELHELLASEVSIFFGNERILSTFTHHGIDITGTTMDREIERVVIEGRKPYTGELNLFGERFLTYYKPIISSDNEVFATIFIGISTEELREETRYIVFRIVTTALLGVLMTLVLVVFMWQLRKIQSVNEFRLTELNLMTQGAKIALWDMDVIAGDPVNPKNVFRWSDDFRHMLGYTDINDFPDILSSWSDLLHPDDKERTLEAFAAHMNDKTGKTPYDLEYRLMMKSGEYRHFHAFGNTLRDEAGIPLRVAGALKDITNDVLLKEYLAKEHERSDELAHWYESIIDATPFPITVTDLDMNWTFVNRAVERFLNTKREDMLGKHCSSWGSNICCTPDCGITRSKLGYKDTMFKDGDNTYKVDVEVLRNMYGYQVGYVEVVQDITHIQNMAKQQAEAANKAKSEFLATMSHEIRTPLNAILGITEIQLLNEKLDPDAKDALRKIYGSGDMLLGLINDILDLSKIESGKLDLVVGSYEIASLICDTAQINVMRIGSKEIVFELNIDENLPFNLYGDELRVKQIMNNILSNAFKYTDEGTVTLTAYTEDTAYEDTVILVISVKDTGQGMTPEQLEKLFDEYSRFNVEANRTTEGAGLGMNITRNLISMMDGKIEMESEFGVGSTFTVKLPQGRVDDKVLGKEMADNLHKFRTDSYTQMTRSQIAREPMPYGSVLIVDDVETNIYVATGLLLPYKLTVDSVDSGLAAIEKVKEGNVYDIIFMDHMMPKMDGMEATKIIRKMGYAEPIVALTANAVVGQMQIFLENGFNDFISKPIDVRQMNVVLNKFIRDKQTPEVIEEARKQAEFDAQNAALDEIPEDMTAKYTEFFLRDALKTIGVLEEFLKKGEPYSDEDMQNYVIFTHGIKSALANIGRQELSDEAKSLEMMGKDRNVEVILANTKPFLEALRAVVLELKPSDDDVDDGVVDEDPEYLCKKLRELAAACDEYDQATAETLLAVLNERTWSKETRALLGKVNEFLFTCEFESVVEAVNEFLAE